MIIQMPLHRHKQYSNFVSEPVADRAARTQP